MNPGDFIEWTYESDGNLVVESEVLWSTPMHRFVPIGCVNNLLISIHDEGDKKIITWLNDKGLFHARVDDTPVASCASLDGLGCSTHEENDVRWRVAYLRDDAHHVLSYV